MILPRPAGSPSAAASFRFADQRHRPVIHQVNLHGGLENSGFHPQSGCTGLLHEVFIEFRCGFGTRSPVEAWTAPFPAIAVESELRDNQQLGSDVTRAEVHLAGVVVENPE